MKKLLLMINKNYWKSIASPILTFIFPILFILIICLMWSIGDLFKPTLILPTAFFLPIIIVLLISLPSSIINIRNSILFKQLQVASIKEWQFLFCFFLYYLIICIFSYFFLVGISYVMFGFDQSLDAAIKDMYSFANWWSIFYSLIMVIITCASLAFLIITVFKSTYLVQMVGIVILICVILTCGVVLPTSVIQHSPTSWLWGFTYAIPIKYPMNLAMESWYSTPTPFNEFGSSIFQLSVPYKSVLVMGDGSTPRLVFSEADKYLNLLMPYAISIVCMGVFAKFYKFSR